MSAQIIDGKSLAAAVRAEAEARIAEMTAAGAATPGLAVVLCGDNPASATYVRNKSRVAERLGIRFAVHHHPADISTAALLRVIAGLNADPAVDAILVQLPLPPQISADAVLEAVDPDKDVDRFHPLNAGRLAEGRDVLAPCTPAGCMEILRRSHQPIGGARAVVVGRSTIVGRPMSVLLTNADATVTLCHSRTRDLAAVCREADILIVAAGRPSMIGAEHVRPGAFVIDVGTTPRDGVVRGDVDRSAVEPIAGWLTPVPGGVGPMTIAMLMRNTVALAAAHRPRATVPMSEA